MKKLAVLVILVGWVKSGFAQESYFTCDELGVYLRNKSVTVHLPGRSKQQLKQKIQSFIKERNYVYKPFYSNDNKISFRDFALICNKSKCGSDLIAKNIFHLAYDSGFVKISLENEIYASFYGAQLEINDNDDVASKKDIPFAPYEFQIPEQYANEYPESIYTFNKKGKTKIKNEELQKILLNFYDRYITDIKAYLEN